MRPVLLIALVWPRKLWYSSLVGVVSFARSPSPPQSFSPPTGKFHTPLLHNVQASRLDVVRDGYRGQGFSARAADFLAHSVPSMSLVYDRKWDIFCTCCAERQIVPVSVTLGNLGDFLLFLFDDRNLAASTVRVFKASILCSLTETDFYPCTVSGCSVKFL